MKVTIYINDKVFSDAEIMDAILTGDSLERAKLIGQLITINIAECLDLLEGKVDAKLESRPMPERGGGGE